jgi:gamma-glutamyl-gamma-aminobutyrate hydrolase PuuD
MVEHLIHISADAVLSQRFLGGATQAIVNSFHHQAVSVVPPGEIWTLSAYEQENVSSSPVIEGIERRDGRVITFQFHPEWMASELNLHESAPSRVLGRKILKGMIEHATTIWTNRDR